MAMKEKFFPKPGEDGFKSLEKTTVLSVDEFVNTYAREELGYAGVQKLSDMGVDITGFFGLTYGNEIMSPLTFFATGSFFAGSLGMVGSSTYLKFASASYAPESLEAQLAGRFKIEFNDTGVATENAAYITRALVAMGWPYSDTKVVEDQKATKAAMNIKVPDYITHLIDNYEKFKEKDEEIATDLIRAFVDGWVHFTGKEEERYLFLRGISQKDGASAQQQVDTLAKAMDIAYGVKLNTKEAVQSKAWGIYTPEFRLRFDQVNPALADLGKDNLPFYNDGLNVKINNDYLMSRAMGSNP